MDQVNNKVKEGRKGLLAFPLDKKNPRSLGITFISRAVACACCESSISSRKALRMKKEKKKKKMPFVEFRRFRQKERKGRADKDKDKDNEIEGSVTFCLVLGPTRVIWRSFASVQAPSVEVKTTSQSVKLSPKHKPWRQIILVL